MTRDYIIWLFWSGGAALMAFAACLWALWRGGRSEQIFAATLGGGWVLSVVAETGVHTGPTVWIVLIDSMILLVFALLSIYDRRLWIAFATACQLNDVITHFVGRSIHMDGYAYVTMLGVWGGWAQILCLLIGMIQHERRSRASCSRRAPSSAEILPPGSARPHS